MDGAYQRPAVRGGRRGGTPLRGAPRGAGSSGSECVPLSQAEEENTSRGLAVVAIAVAGQQRSACVVGVRAVELELVG